MPDQIRDDTDDRDADSSGGNPGGNGGGGDSSEQNSDQSTTVESGGGATSDQIGCDSCGTPESEMLVVFDRNLNYPWKSGNPYARMCPGCGTQTFTSESYWQSQEVPHVIPKGEDTPVPLFECPYSDCHGTFLGMQDECPHCEGQLEWEN